MLNLCLAFEGISIYALKEGNSGFFVVIYFVKNLGWKKTRAI
jgi:hypothetical protein